MQDEQTNTTDTGGKETTPDIPKTEEVVKKPKEVISDSEKDSEKISKERKELKTENDAYEAEQLRSEKLRAERVKGGKAIAGQPQLTPEEKEEKDAQGMADEISNAFF